MECDVPATVDVMHLRAGFRHGGPINQQVRRVSVAADGEDRRMLQQEQIVVGRAALCPSFVDGSL
jgi:hypothetical protein